MNGMRKLLFAFFFAWIVGPVSLDAQPGDPTQDPEIFRKVKTGSTPDAWRTQPVPTQEVLVTLANGVNPVSFGLSRGLVVRHRLVGSKSTYIFRARSVADAQAFEESSVFDPHVIRAYNNARTFKKRFSFDPNDPYFFAGNPTAAFPGQWYLVSSGAIDVRVQGAWNRDVTGAGVVIGIVDDGFQTNHPDLQPNFSASNSYDFGGNDANPDPVHVDDVHGISVAGVAGARGGNGIGVTGVAPLVGLAGLRVDFENQTIAMFVNATLYKSSGGTVSIGVKNHSYGQGTPYGNATAESDAVDDSAAAGTVHVFSAGNERGDPDGGEDSNKKMPQNNPNVLAIAALGSNGKFAPYSSFGANVVATAPSSASGLLRIITTDRTTKALGYNGAGDSFPDADYTSLFGGTSSSAPVAAGVMALVKQVRPNLDSRLAKHLLARTCDLIDATDATEASDGGWTTNAAGFRFNPNYGFGLIDADELTQLAATAPSLSPIQVFTGTLTTVGEQIPDNNTSGLTRSFTIQSSTPLEEVEVYLDIAHVFRGDVEAYLVSPGGTKGRLMMRSGQDNGNGIKWSFTTHKFWGEVPFGTWTLIVADVAAGDVGTWQQYQARMRMGQLLAPNAGLQSISVTPLMIFGGSKTTVRCTVQLTGPAGGTGQAVSLSSSAPSVLVVPANVVVPSGSTSVTFNLAHKAVSQSQTVTVQASAGGSQVSTATSVVPNPIRSVIVAPKTVVGGSSTQVKGTVTLLGPAGPSGTVVVLESTDTSAAGVPATVQVPPGFTRVNFPITHHDVTSTKTTKIRATTAGFSRERVLTVTN